MATRVIDSGITHGTRSAISDGISILACTHDTGIDRNAGAVTQCTQALCRKAWKLPGVAR